MINKKELINNFINKIKKLKTKYLLNIYNNLLNLKKGGLNTIQNKLLNYCYIYNPTYSIDYIKNNQLLKYPPKYDKSINLQLSIDAYRFYSIINKIINDADNELNKYKFVCSNLKIFSTTDNFYLINLIIFLQYYFKNANQEANINKKNKIIKLKINDNNYIIQYKYHILTNFIDIKVSKKNNLSSSSIISNKSSNITLPIKSKSNTTSSNNSNISQNISSNSNKSSSINFKSIKSSSS